MTLEVFAVYDSTVALYSKPFYSRSKGEALRSWVHIANDSESSIYKNPEDYTLFHMASFEEKTGLFTNLEQPLSMGQAQEFKTAN